MGGSYIPSPIQVLLRRPRSDNLLCVQAVGSTLLFKGWLFQTSQGRPFNIHSVNGWHLGCALGQMAAGTQVPACYQDDHLGFQTLTPWSGILGTPEYFHTDRTKCLPPSAYCLVSYNCVQV